MFHESTFFLFDTVFNSRFRSQSLQPNWDMSSGVSDAIAFRIDGCGFLLHGIGVYRTSKNRRHCYKCEVGH